MNRRGAAALRFAAALLAAAACFFVGRRIYYRLIQPPPPWEHATPKNERVVAAAGLEVSLWADETLVHNPTSLSIDARGRVWVTEAVNYREWQNHQRDAGTAFHPGGDRIVILDDTNGDGRADSSQVFAEDPELVAPTGICVLGNRVYVACSPHILVFIDDDGDDRADRKEILLTGFGGRDHDHGVHGLTPGPDGRLYISVGNAGPHIVTDQSGWTLRAGSAFQSFGDDSPDAPPVSHLNRGGLVSDDDRVYVGGLVFSIQPDGSDLRVHAHNARNPYEVAVDSLGDLWQTDNDDSSSCRLTWILDGANLGFASADGRRTWQADQRPGQDAPQAHWHQDDPGVLPAGLIYGTGAPTGLLRCETDRLGPELQGALLACDAGLGAVFAFQPIPDGAGFRFEPHPVAEKFVWAEPLGEGHTARSDGLAATWFRPTDVALSPSGELFVADWYDSYVGAHRVNDNQAAGRIYVVRRPDRDAPADTPPLDDPIAALQNPSPELRWEAHRRLLEQGDAAVPQLQPLLASDNPFVRARAVWILAAVGDAGRNAVRELLDNPDPDLRTVALRALIAAGAAPADLANTLADDESPAVRRTAAAALRAVPWETAREPLLRLASHLDAHDPFALEAFGLAAEPHADPLFQELQLRTGHAPDSWPPEWSALVWRLHPPAALPALKERLQTKTLTDDERLQTIDTLAFTGTTEAQRLLADWSAQPQGSQATRAHSAWWAEFLAGIETSRPDAGSNTAVLDLPIRYQPVAAKPVDADLIRTITDLEGDADRGRTLYFSEQAACSRCHRHTGQAGGIGPDLTSVARRLDPAQLIEAILYPSNAILTGYETWSIVDTQGKIATGLLEAVDDDLVLRSADNQRIAVPQSEIAELIRAGVSIMPDSLGKTLTPQQLADLLAFLRAPPPPTPAADPPHR